MLQCSTVTVRGTLPGAGGPTLPGQTRLGEHPDFYLFIPGFEPAMCIQKAQSRGGARAALENGEASIS